MGMVASLSSVEVLDRRQAVAAASGHGEEHGGRAAIASTRPMESKLELLSTDDATAKIEEEFPDVMWATLSDSG